MAGDVRFVRIHGRIVPIKSKGGDKKDKPADKKPAGHNIQTQLTFSTVNTTAKSRFKEHGRLGATLGALAGFSVGLEAGGFGGGAIGALGGAAIGGLGIGGLGAAIGQRKKYVLISAKSKKK